MQLTFAFILLFVFEVHGQYKIEVLDTNTFHLGEGVILSKTSFRGLSVVDDKTIWVSGSKGTTARSIDGGKSFSFQQLIGYEKSDFRDIEAFDDKRAIIMSSGTPAYILKTVDGGNTWKEVYKNTDTAYFLDAMDFWDDKRGILVGDPINGHFLLMQTNDGGETWQQSDSTKSLKAMEGEAVFAASGTSLRCWGKNEFGFVTGGNVSRLLIGELIDDKIYFRTRVPINISSGSNSKGSFSLIPLINPHSECKNKVLVVGGDYLLDTLISHNSTYQSITKFGDCKELWDIDNRTQYSDVKGYRSCVEKFYNNSFIVCGTSGIDILLNNKWINISKQPFHVVRKAKKGKAVFLAGPKGKIGKLIY